MGKYSRAHHNEAIKAIMATREISFGALLYFNMLAFMERAIIKGGGVLKCNMKQSLLRRGMESLSSR